MKRAMKEPTWLFAVLPGNAPEVERLADVLSAEVTLYRADDHTVLWGAYATGKDAREDWATVVRRDEWAAALAHLRHQPILHLLPRTGEWSEKPHNVWFGEATVDATVKTRKDRTAGERPGMRLPAAEVLPQSTSCQVWPVLGHPGRIVIAGPGRDALYEVIRLWAPGGYADADTPPKQGRQLVEPPLTWGGAQHE